jgi:hypothetical protein
MPDTNSCTKTEDKLTFGRKVWIAGSIFAIIVIFLFLINTLFSVFLLILAGLLVAVYFHGCADLLKIHLHCPSKLSVVISIIINITSGDRVLLVRWVQVVNAGITIV